VRVVKIGNAILKLVVERLTMKKRYIVLLKYEGRDGDKWNDWETFNTEEDAERFQVESLMATGSSTRCTRAILIRAEIVSM
jgi:hypothetical protein